jgi:hypothetical protein
MKLDERERPTVNELMLHPKICFILRAQHLQEIKSNFNRKAV